MEAQMRRRIDMAVRPAPLAQGMHGHRQGPGGGHSSHRWRGARAQTRRRIEILSQFRRLRHRLVRLLSSGWFQAAHA
jgi:hypothetical protein